MPKTAKPKKMWVYAPKKPAPPKAPEVLKRDVEMKANALVEAVLKPLHIQPPPEDPQFNYIEDIATKWVRSFFYFYALYRSAGPYALGGQFEAKFARLTYLGGDHFNLAAQRYTGEWIEIFPDLTLDECLDAVRNDPWFHP
jgi:hypothetical protein